MRWHTSIYHCQFTGFGEPGTGAEMPKIECGPIMATKLYLIIHRRGDSDGEIAPFSRSSFPANRSLPPPTGRHVS